MKQNSIVFYASLQTKFQLKIITQIIVPHKYLVVDEHEDILLKLDQSLAMMSFQSSANTVLFPAIIMGVLYRKMGCKV